MWRLIGMKEGKKKGGRGLRKERSLIDLKPKDGKSLAPLTVFFLFLLNPLWARGGDWCWWCLEASLNRTLLCVEGPTETGCVHTRVRKLQIRSCDLPLVVSRRLQLIEIRTSAHWKDSFCFFLLFFLKLRRKIKSPIKKK